MEQGLKAPEYPKVKSPTDRGTHWTGMLGLELRFGVAASRVDAQQLVGLDADGPEETPG